MSSRTRLPNRRPSELIDIQFRARQYIVVYSRFSDGTVAEVFIEPRKIGNDAATDSRDAAILISIALQYGAPLEALRAAVSRIEGSRPASLAGAVLDLLAKEGGAS